MDAKFDLQHFCCGPKGCQMEIDAQWRKRSAGANSKDNNTFLDLEF